MKRILFFNDCLALGGTEILLVNMLNHLSSKKCSVTLLLPQPSADDVLLEKLSTSIIIKYIHKSALAQPVAGLYKNLMIFFPRIFASIYGLKASDYDEVVCFKDGFYARIFSKMNIPKILWIHNIFYRRKYQVHSFKERLAVYLNKQQLKISELSYRRFDKVICVSDACKYAYLDILYNNQSQQQNIHVLYNAVNTQQIIELSKAAIPDLPRQDVTKFIMLTRPSPEKRNDRLLNAAIRLKNEGYQFRCYVLGGGVAETQINNNELSDVVSFLGQIANPFPYILQSNWLICTSERESFSLALLEAMVLKTPVITTNCGGPANIIGNGKYGILVENSTEGVYRGMKSVLDNPQLSVTYSAHLEEVVKQFDYDGWLANVDELLGV